MGVNTQDGLYEEAAAAFSGALSRLAGAYEFDPEKRRDLLQEIHLALWRSFAGFDGRCGLRTWVYRVAHNTATSHTLRRRRANATFISLEEIDEIPDPRHGPAVGDRSQALARLLELIHRLKPIDRQLILSYLEGLDAASIGEVTGISAGNVATKIHRIKAILARRFQEGERHAG